MHEVHKLEADDENWPDAHDRHTLDTEAPVVVEYEPDMHGAQVLALEIDE
jgi:hypothetical protein